jgi:hypothetical protein
MWQISETKESYLLILEEFCSMQILFFFNFLWLVKPSYNTTARSQELAFQRFYFILY